MKKKIVGVVAIVAILAAISATVMQVSATQDLKITDHNLNTLNSFTYSGAWYNVEPNGYLLEWYYGGGECFELPHKAPSLAPAPHTDKITATIMADYEGYYWGECVSMVKNLAHSTVVTDDWQRGRHVMNGGISSGTTIATFYWNSTERRYKYSGHAAIFREYTIDGIMVWDQNWYENDKKPNPEGIVGMHKISKWSANSYYVIQV
jgi:hypothetical protein